MIWAHDMTEYAWAFYIIYKIFCYKKIIYSPPYISVPCSCSHIPPCIIIWFSIKWKLTRCQWSAAFIPRWRASFFLKPQRDTRIDRWSVPNASHDPNWMGVYSTKLYAAAKCVRSIVVGIDRSGATSIRQYQRHHCWNRSHKQRLAVAVYYIGRESGININALSDR